MVKQVNKQPKKSKQIKIQRVQSLDLNHILFSDRFEKGSTASSMAYDQGPVRKEWAKMRATIREEVEDEA